MRVTGWTPAVLRAQPARVIRAHFHRIWAGLAWSPELADAARQPAPPRSAFASLADYAAARSARTTVAGAFADLCKQLWPEG